MDNFEQLLKNQFEAELSDKFVKQAFYYQPMDFLEYVSQDTTVVADRVDSFLTVLWNADRSEIIGFRCKGFRYVFEQIKDIGKLYDKDWKPIVHALETVFSKVGECLFEDMETDNPRRVLAYRKSVELAERDNVSLPLDLAA